VNQDATNGEDRIANDLKCMRCGYNLAGLETSKQCPECGLPIAATLAGPDLRYANPFFVHRLIQGTTGVLLGLSIWCLVYVANLLIHLAESPPRTYDYWLNHVWLIGWSVLWFSALILIAPRESATTVDFESALSLRRLLLYCAILLMVEHIVWALMSLSQRIIVLSAGEKIAEGRPDAIAADPTVVEVYLGHAARR